MADPNIVLLAAEEGGQSNFLIPNGTFFFVLLIFLIVLGVIAKWVVPPISKVLNEREAMVKQTVEDSRKAADQFSAADADYESEMGKARTEASRIRDEARTEGRKVVEDMRGRASEEAATALARAEEQLKQQSDAIAGDLRASVDSLSQTLASRVLGVEVTTRTVPVSSGQER
ncbi:F0F1 ATP synthase subunit B [Mycolicibacterium rutilum]|nr:F0F1 ATP synthase subunit B [Mycolicibacterium rutilum]